MGYEFEQTRVARDDGTIRLVGGDGRTLLQVHESQLDELTRGGFVDPDDLHFSLYEYARMCAEVPEGSASAADDKAAVDRLLRGLGFEAGD